MNLGPHRCIRVHHALGVGTLIAATVTTATTSASKAAALKVAAAMATPALSNGECVRLSAGTLKDVTVPYARTMGLGVKERLISLGIVTLGKMF